MSGEEDLELRLCLGHNLDSTLEHGDADLLRLGGVNILPGLGEEEPEWLLCLGDTLFTRGCGDDDLDGLCLGDVLDFNGGEDPEQLCLEGDLDFTSGSGDDSERLCLCGVVDCSLACILVIDPCLGGVPDFTLG